MTMITIHIDDDDYLRIVIVDDDDDDDDDKNFLVALTLTLSSFNSYRNELYSLYVKDSLHSSTFSSLASKSAILCPLHRGAKTLVLYISLYSEFNLENAGTRYIL